MRIRLDVYTWTVASLFALGLCAANGAMAQEGTPEGVDLDECRAALDACVIAAQTPADITVCSEQEARCVADEMDVPVPENVPIDVLIQCAATATTCALTAPNGDALSSCSWNFDQCVTGAIENQLSCLDKWALCVANDPVLLPICSLELLGCTD
jgi:hypothetical protein